MIYLPDTNVWIAYLNPGQTEAKVRIARHRPEELALCSVVKAELWWGAYHSRCQKANLSLLRQR